MTTSRTQQDRATERESAEILEDPVAYLARHGIEAELVEETTLPVAA